MSRQLVDQIKTKLRRKSQSVFWILSCLAVGFIGYSSAKYTEAGSASLASSKRFEKRMADYKINVVGKHLAVIRSEIEAIELPDTDDQVAVLKATVFLNQAVDENLSYRLFWDSDMKVEPISGTEGYLDGSLVGQVQEVEFRLKNFSHESKKVVTFLIEAKQNGRQFGSTALISSRPEDSMEYIAPAKLEAAEQAAAGL